MYVCARGGAPRESRFARLADMQLILMPSWLPKESTTAWSAVQLTCAVRPLVARRPSSPSLMQMLQGSGTGKEASGAIASHMELIRQAAVPAAASENEGSSGPRKPGEEAAKAPKQAGKDKSVGTGQGDTAERPAVTLQPAPMARASFQTADPEVKTGKMTDAERSAQASAAEPPAKVMAPKCHAAVNLSKD